MRIEITHNVYLHSADLKESSVLKLLNRILEKEDQIMASIQEVKDAVAAKAAEVTTAIQAAIADEKAEVTAAIQALKDQINAGGSVTQEDLDALLASVSGIGSTAADIEGINTEGPQ